MDLTSLHMNQIALSAKIRRNMGDVTNSVERLSSGNRINRAVDDVAGMSISSRMTTRITSLRSGTLNVLQASSLLQVADNGLRNIDGLLQRMNVLATQAHSGGVTEAERGFLDIEFQHLKEEINRTLEETQFNERRVFKTASTSFTAAAAATDSEALFDPTHASDLALWLDADDRSQIELTYVTNNLGGATATGAAGTNTLTTSANISARLEVGSRIRLGAAGAVTTADALGADTYTITNVAGTTVTVAESLTNNYAGATVRTGAVSRWLDKSGENSHANQGNANNMPIWVSTSTDFNSEGTIRFFRSNRTNLNLTPDLNNVAGGFNTVFFNMHWLPGNSQMPFGFQTYDLWASNTNRFGFNTGAGNVYGIDPTPQLSNSTHQLTASFYNGSVAGNSQLYIDGQQQTLAQLQGPNGSRTATDSMRISSWTNNTSYTINAYMSEFIILDTQASPEMQSLIEQYQSSKWGISLTGGTAEAPGIFSEGYSIERTAESGTLVGDLTERLGGLSPNYSIVEGNTSSIFSIDPTTGEIRVSNASALASSSTSNYLLTVEADLGGSETLSLEVSISVGGGDEGGFNFQIDKSSQNRLTIDIGEIDLEDVLSNTDIHLRTLDDAKEAFDVLQNGIDFITERRAYVGSKQSQADIILSSIGTRLSNQDAARAVIEDTDIARTSTDYANQQAKYQMSIYIAAQATRLNSDVVLGILNEGIQL